jgi:hypothetical protein
VLLPPSREDIWGNGGKTPRIFNTRGGGSVRFTPVESTAGILGAGLDAVSLSGIESGGSVCRLQDRHGIWMKLTVFWDVAPCSL